MEYLTNILNQKCFEIKGEIENSKEKVSNTQQELDYRESKLKEIKYKLDSLKEIENEGKIKDNDKLNVKKMQKDSKISEDEHKKYETQVEEIVDKYVGKVHVQTNKKEKEHCC